MSSMFKKKGGPAFKPKIPSARPRPAASAPLPSSQPPKAPSATILAEPQVQDPSTEASQESSAGTPVVESETSRSKDNPEEPHEKTLTPPSTEKSQPTNKDPGNDNAVEQPLERVEDESASLGSQKRHDKHISVPVAPQATPTETESEQSPSVVVPEQTPIPIATAEKAAADTNARLIETPEGSPSIPDEQAVPTTSDESQPSASGEANKPPSVTPKPRTRRQSSKIAQATQEEGGDSEASARPRKRQRKATQDGEDATPKQPRKRRAANPDGEAKPRRARSVTPEDAESQVVDLQKLKMSDLTKDLHIGKKFSRHDELRERERKKRMKSKLGELGLDDEDTPEKTDGSQRDTAKRDSPATPTSAAAAAAAGPQFRIVDGQIVVDQSSLVMDRHARAAAAQQDMETVEENDFTRLITSNSFMNTSKLKGPNIWNEADTELFYRGLRMFGTDFEMISKMFPGKQRRHIKLKFNREERHCPRRIDAAMIGEKTIKMDIEEYKAHTGAEFEPVESIEAEQRKIQEDFEAEQQRVRDEQEEEMRKKREALFADEEDEGKKKKKGKRKGKQAVVYGLNGEPITAEA